MLVTLLGIVTLVRLVQSSNAHPPMLVTLLGMVTLVRLEQLANAPSPMLVTLLGIVTLVKLGAVIERIGADAGNAVGDRDARQAPALRERTVPDVGDAARIVTLVRLQQKPNALSPMLVTPLPSVTLVSLMQLVNAPDPMLVTLPGIVTLVRAVQ